ncbi:hypothetical protein NVSP9465_02085 [Novosphingobium sp. CECT 9465]|nr:hypothetical protein NVSP9465_02085 [Novosphingobium sp. CECT 9465]
MLGSDRSDVPRSLNAAVATAVRFSITLAWIGYILSVPFLFALAWWVFGGALLSAPEFYGRLAVLALAAIGPPTALRLISKHFSAGQATNVHQAKHTTNGLDDNA